MKAVMAEFLIRWPCPAATDEEHHLARMTLLFSDCRELAPGMMRKAGDFVARIPNRPNVMPSASEITGAVEAIMADRAAKQAAAQREEAKAAGKPVPAPGDKTALYWAANLRTLKAGGRMMQTATGATFVLGERGERKCVRRDGSVIDPHFRRDGEVEGVRQGFYVRHEDADVAAACYAHYGADFRLDGCRVVEVVR